jgi:ABC-type sugar transport system permease subunit
VDREHVVAVGPEGAGELEPRASPGPWQARRTRRRRRSLWPYAFVLPTLAMLGLVFAYPLVTVVRDSFYAGSPSQLIWVGGANYRNVLHDPVFLRSVANNLRLLVTVPVMTALALAIALFLDEGIRGWRQYRAVVFLPYVLPATAIGLSFSYLLQRNGVLNTILRSLGLGAFALDWLGSAKVVMASIGGVVIWQQLGFGVVVFTASLLALPREVTEAALIDGAGWWQLRRRVILPQIREIIEFFMVLEAITVLSWVFNYVYVLTGGGPGDASSVMEFYIWKNGFSLGSIGVAATVAVLLLGMAGILIFVYFRLRVRHAEGGAEA